MKTFLSNRDRWMDGLWAVAVPLAVAVHIGAGNVDAGILIDDFENGGQTVRSIDDPGPTTVASTSAIGGSRTLEIIPGTDPGTELTVTGGVLSGSHSDFDVISASSFSVVTWDGGGAGLGGIDLTSGGVDDAFALEMFVISDGNYDIKFTVKSAFGDASLTANSLARGNAIESIVFEDFGADPRIFESADAITLELHSEPASAMSIGLIKTVPEPGSAILLGSLATLCFVDLRKRSLV